MKLPHCIVLPRQARLPHSSGDPGEEWCPVVRDTKIGQSGDFGFS